MKYLYDTHVCTVTGEGGEGNGGRERGRRGRGRKESRETTVRTLECKNKDVLFFDKENKDAVAITSG